MIYDLDFSPLKPYTAALKRGVCLTIILSVLSTILGSIIGAIAGVALRWSRIRDVLLVCNDIVRAIPIIVLMFFLYYFPYQDAFGLQPPSAFVVSVLALSISQAAFTADLVRGAIDGVSRSSVEAAMAIGLTDIDIARFIVAPDVLRQILPSLNAFFIGNIKLSSIAAVIGCEEVVFTARVAVSQTYRSTEAWIVVGLIYVFLVIPLAWAARRLERSDWLKRR